MPTIHAAPLPFVSLDEAKKQCRVEHNDDDDFIQSLVESAIAHLDGYHGVLGRCIAPQKWVQEFDVANSKGVSLPLSDVNSVVVSLNGSPLAGGAYKLNKSGFYKCVEFVDPVTGVIEVFMTCGFASVAQIPSSIKHAVKMLVSHWYDNREAASFVTGAQAKELPYAVTNLIIPFKLNLLAM